MIKLNLGCGEKYIRGYINTDINANVKADKHFDLNVFPYPFSKNYCDEILMDNVLEHLEDVTSVLKELHRIIKPEGILILFVPYAKSDGAFQDPTHKHFFTENSLEYYTTEGFYSNFKFKILVKKLFSANKTKLSKLRYFIPFKSILKYIFFNMYDGVYFKLQAIKGKQND